LSANPFLELGLSEKLVNSLSSLGFEEPTPIQTKAIPVLLEGRDVLGQAATGTGKTAAFSLPLIQRYCLDTEPGKPQVLILTPTRELCIQVSEAINSFARSSGVYVLPVYGGQDYSRQIKALSRGVQIVVATPGRALDHIRRGTLNLTEIKAVVLDEADEMLDIFKMQCKKGCYQLSDGVEELVRDYITEENGDPETFGNARGVRNIFEHILVAQNNRLAAMETVTKEDLMTLTQDDVLHARGKLD